MSYLTRKPMQMRIVYAARCSWWDSIDKVGRTRSGLPGCPHCGSVLFEMENQAEWEAAIAATAVERGADYPAFIAWLRGRCFPTLDAAYAVYVLDQVGRSAG